MTKDQQHEFHRYFTYRGVYKRWLHRAEIMGFKTVRDMLRGLYQDQQRTSYSIAMLIGCGQMAVLRMMDKMSIPRRPAITEKR
jgi:hypothetical protein